MSQAMMTDLGTPGAGGWPLVWFERVNGLEHELGRRICGGVCADGAPCRRVSTHSSGRCSHHGGNHLTGAPKGNENARIHGLYSRRLQRCGESCVLWGACPFAEDDLLEIPLSNRPNCVYEQTEYDRLVDHYVGKDEGVDVHLAHSVALLQVMVSRAAAALSLDGFTETTRASGEQYSMESSKMSAALQAFLRLAREHRQYRHELMQEIAAAEEKTANQKPVGLADRVRPLLKKAEGVLEDAIAYEKRRRAALKAGVPFIEEEDERFYEEHGFYPAIDEEWDEDPDEEGSSDKDEQDGQDDLTGKEERTEEEGEEEGSCDKDGQDGQDGHDGQDDLTGKGEKIKEEGEGEKSFDTDDADGADCGKEGGLGQDGLGGKGKAKGQEGEGEGQEGVMAAPP